MSENENTAADWTNLIGPATKDLLYPSETDARVVPFVWTADGGQKEITAAAVARLAGHPSEAAVEEIPAELFFGKVTKKQSWHTEVGRERARRFTELEALLKEHLHGLRVFRIGSTAIDVYVVGVDTQDRLAGVSTKVVET
ncbi:MAG: nuclease A inhibitor family protein [Pyrinomonadaceae bacterium]